MKSIMTIGRFELVRKSAANVNFLRSTKGRSRNYRYAGETPETFHVLRGGYLWYVIEQYIGENVVHLHNLRNDFKYTETGDAEQVAIDFVYEAAAYDHQEMMSEAI